MSKYKILNKLETMINILNGEESMEAIMRGEIKVDLNPVHERLTEIKKSYEDELEEAGAIFVGDRHFNVRDIILPVRCQRSGKDAFDTMKSAFRKKKIHFSAIHSDHYKLFPSEKGEKTKYVSLRITLEYMKEHNGTLPAFWGNELYDCDSLFGEDLCCLVTQYIDVFIDDWFISKKMLLPIAFGVRLGWSDVGCIIKPQGEKNSVLYKSDYLGRLVGPWLTTSKT
jgi:hypothetical protein